MATRRLFILVIPLLLALGAGAGTNASAGAGQLQLQIQGLYSVSLAPEATPAEALRLGAPVKAAKPGELLALSGMGFSPEALIICGGKEVRPLPAPFSDERRLVFILPRLPAGPTTLYVALPDRRSKGRMLRVLPAAKEAGERSYAAFAMIDRFLARAQEVLRASLEELPEAAQEVARMTAELLLRDRLLALQIEGGLTKLSADELAVMDSLLASVGLVPMLRSYSSLLEGAPMETLRGLAEGLSYKGRALRALGAFLSEVRITDWDEEALVSFGGQSFGELLWALGELDLALAGNVRALGDALMMRSRMQHHMKLSQGIAALAERFAVQEGRLAELASQLAGLASEMEELRTSFTLSLDSGLAQVNVSFQGLRARVENEVLPSLGGIIARLDSPDYGLAEIKTELAQLESQMAFTVLPSLAELLHRPVPDLTPIIERLDQRVIPSLEALQSALAVTNQQVNALLAEVSHPQHGLVEIKAELKALEAKVDKIWRCLSGLEIRYEEIPGEAMRAPVDVILAIDSSGSMKTNDPRRLRIATAKQLIAQLDPGRDQAGIVSWDNDIDFVQPLTSDLARVEQMLERIDASGATNLNAGLAAAIDEFVRGRPEAKKVIIFLTDGDGTYTFSGQPGSPVALARQKGITIYAIGLGSAPARRKLEDMAKATGGRFYIAPTAEDLRQIYEEISQQLITPVERVMRITCPMD